MPHLIIEYSAGLAGDAEIEQLLDELHGQLADSGVFAPDHIRVRAYPAFHYRSGGAMQPFIHAQLRIHAGRTQSQRRSLSEGVLEVLKAQGWQVEVITVEVVEMERGSYSKFSRS